MIQAVPYLLMHLAYSNELRTCNNGTCGSKRVPPRERSHHLRALSNLCNNQQFQLFFLPQHFLEWIWSADLAAPTRRSLVFSKEQIDKRFRIRRHKAEQTCIPVATLLQLKCTGTVGLHKNLLQTFGFDEK